MDRPCSVKRKKYTAAAKKPTSAASFSHASVLPVSMIVLRLRSRPPSRGSTGPRQPFLDQPLDRWSEPGAVVGVAHLLDGLRLRRIGVDGVGDRPQPQAADHR